MTLQARLLITVGGLLSAALLVTGILVVGLTRASLVDQLDDQLRLAAGSRLDRVLGLEPGSDDPSGRQLAVIVVMFRWDLKLEKSFPIGEQFFITPYLWVVNVLGSENVNNVWQSTGSPYTTGYMNTPEGKAAANNQSNPEGYVQDYNSLERDPVNFGVPRMIRLGLKLNVTKIGL